jgi:hypothetical protein
MRPGNLHGLDGFWFRGLGDTEKEPKVLHPDIRQYSKKHLDPQVRSGKLKLIEAAEQIYTFRLFTPEFCKKLIDEVEFQGGWETGIDDESGLSGFGKIKIDPKLMVSLRTQNEMDTTLSLKKFPKITKTINDTTKRIVSPAIADLWKSFKVKKYDQPYLLKYEPDKVRKMNLHYDAETVAMVVYLNTDYEGGGTYFPRWKFRLQPKKPGQAAMWPGGVSHEHIGLPITGGVRYLLCCAFD